MLIALRRTIAKSFLTCGITNTLGGSEDSFIREDIQEVGIVSVKKTSMTLILSPIQTTFSTLTDKANFFRY